MEIEIQTKKENPLLARTEVHLFICHQGEKTPKRDLVRSELAEQMNVKKDCIIIDHMTSHFGATGTEAYAKIYKSASEAKKREREHLLKRNPVSSGKKKPETEEEQEPVESPPAEPEKEGDA